MSVERSGGYVIGQLCSACANGRSQSHDPSGGCPGPNPDVVALLRAGLKPGAPVPVSAVVIETGRMRQSDSPPATFDVTKEFSHYYRPCPFDGVDVYRVLLLFGVTDPCIQHAIKKLLVTGGRTAGKSADKDIHEAIASLKRWQEMRAEETE